MIDPMSEVPWWANILIFMEMYQYYLLACILPTIYLVIVKLFGFPLLQRWSQEVVIILYPTKVKFAKLTSQYQPYFQFQKGIYWVSNPLSNVNQGHKFNPSIPGRKGRKAYDNKCMECGKLKREHGTEDSVGHNENQILVYTHAINQAVYDMKRRETKVDELLNSDHKIKSIPRHGIWIMKNPLLHFHRHWEIVIGPNNDVYELRKATKRQQFSVSLWHTIGVTKQILQTEQIPIDQVGENGGSNTKQVLLYQQVTQQVVLDHMKYVSEYHNFSSNTAYRICKKLNKIEANFYYWVSGSFNILPILILVGAAACIGLVIFMFHGGGPSLGPMPLK